MNARGFKSRVEQYMLSSGESYREAYVAVLSNRDRFDNRGAIIIAGMSSSGRTTLLNRLLLELYVDNGSNFDVVAVRSDLSEAFDVAELTYEKVLITKSLLPLLVQVKPDAFVFDSNFEVNALSDGAPHLTMSNVFYVVPASGDTVEELRLSAIESFYSLTGCKNLFMVRKILVTEVNDLGAVNPFIVTDFIL